MTYDSSLELCSCVKITWRTATRELTCDFYKLEPEFKETTDFQQKIRFWHTLSQPFILNFAICKT